MKFSEIMEAYNLNVKNLDEARLSFEEEARNFIQTVNIFVNTDLKKRRQIKPASGVFYWHFAEAGSSKGATPLGFYAESILNFAVRPTGAKNFKNKAAMISLQVSFDQDTNQFAFKGVFTNTDEASDYLDEKLAEICKATQNTLPEAFKFSEVHRTKEYVAFKSPMNNELWDNFGKLIIEFFNLCEKAVLATFPETEGGASKETA